MKIIWVTATPAHFPRGHVNMLVQNRLGGGSSHGDNVDLKGLGGEQTTQLISVEPIF